MKHTGSCFCGAVEVQVTGAPEGMGYCHCRSCRSWSGGPVNAFTLWKPEAVRITAGAQHVATFEKTPMSQRKYCAECGGHLMTNHPTLGLVDVFAATLPTLPFTPGRARQLRRDGAADAGWAAQTEGFSRRAWRLRRDDRRVERRASTAVTGCERCSAPAIDEAPLASWIRPRGGRRFLGPRHGRVRACSLEARATPRPRAPS